jgi:hypothetical protein
VLLDIVVGLLTGLVLWAVLPRGVVLTRSRSMTENDTWYVKNESALPVRIVSITWLGSETHDDNKRNHVERELEGRVHGVKLALVDSDADTSRVEQRRPWDKVIVSPGDSLRATVLNMRGLRIRYRRAGLLGIFERREVRIQGGT